jgi:hypothetical protein
MDLTSDTALHQCTQSVHLKSKHHYDYILVKWSLHFEIVDLPWLSLGLDARALVALRGPWKSQGQSSRSEKSNQLEKL